MLLSVTLYYHHTIYTKGTLAFLPVEWHFSWLGHFLNLTPPTAELHAALHAAYEDSLEQYCKGLLELK